MINKEDEGLEKFLALYGDRSTAELLEGRPSDKAVEALGRGASALTNCGD